MEEKVEVLAMEEVSGWWVVERGIVAVDVDVVVVVVVVGSMRCLIFEEV